MGNEKKNSYPLMSPNGGPAMPIYEIRVRGCMDELFWSDWFGGLEATTDRDRGETILHGAIMDQAELYGLLSRLRNKGLTLISVQQVRQNASRE